MADPVAIRYEGLREVAHAFREIDRSLLGTLEHDLKDVGEVVRAEATRLFIEWGRQRRDKRGRRLKYGSTSATARGFETRVRARGYAEALVVVAQRKPTTTHRRADYTQLQLDKALYPARASKIGEARRLVKSTVESLVHEYGF